LNVYGLIKYGSDIYGNSPAVISYFCNGEDITPAVVSSMQVTDTINQIKTTELTVKI